MSVADEATSARLEDRRRDTARLNAELQSRRTVERLTAGIAALTSAGIPISAKTVERETGLSYRTITRTRRRTSSIASTRRTSFKSRFPRCPSRIGERGVRRAHQRPPVGPATRTL